MFTDVVMWGARVQETLHSRAQAAAQINIPLSSRSAPLPRDAQSSFRVLKLKGGGLENALLTS